MKKIMILTAEKTGTGHKSVANAIEGKLDKTKYEVKQIDSFTMMNRIGMLLENIYIPITTRFPVLYYIAFLFTQYFPNAMHFIVYLKSRRKLKKQINEFKPDLIISVHSMFTKSVSHFLKKEKMNIPFFVDVIDLVKPPNVWYDKDADFIFVPTEEIRKDYIKKGINEEKLLVVGFPTREDIVKRETPKEVIDKVNILLVNPSVNLSKNVKFVKEVSRLNNVNISVICGRDTRMYNKLTKEQELGNISKDVNIYGFVKNMNEFLENSHIILTKAGPNMLLEAVKSSTAVVVTDYILGQENYNYEFITKNKYGFKCTNPNEIYSKLKEFISSSSLKECLENVHKAECKNGSKIIADYIDSKFE